MKLILEAYINLLPNHEDKKRQHVDAAWNMLQNSYSKIGGIHGSGFNSKEDMIKNIPMWKLVIKKGQVVAGAFYKDKQGRKRVAVATDGTDEGKSHLAKIMTDDLHQGRAFGEVSGPSLAFSRKYNPDFDNHIIPYDHVANIMARTGDEISKPDPNDPHVRKYPEIAHHFYRRKIGNEWHTKLMVGKPGNPLPK